MNAEDHVCGDVAAAGDSLLVPRSPGSPRSLRSGPVPAPDPSLWADTTRRRVLLELARHDEPVSLAELAKELGGHPNTTRAHLETLRLAGLVSRVTEAPGAPGRPAWLHELTDIGRSAARRAQAEESGGSIMEPGQDHMAAAFIRHLAKAPDATAVAAEVGREWGVALPSPSRARTRAGRRRAVQDLFDRMGFTPVRLVPDGDAAADALAGASSETSAGADVRAGTPVADAPVADAPAESGPDAEAPAATVPDPARDEFTMRSCPLLDPAREHPEIVCSVHRGLVIGFLEQTGAGPDEVDVDLDPWGLSDGCRLALTWHDPAPER